MADRLKGKVATVTGGSSGIGQATAIAFSREGAHVAVADIDEAAGRAVVEEITTAGGTAIFVRTDVTSEADVERLVTRTVDELGGLDIAFNNAGSPGGFTTAATCTNEDFTRAVSINMQSVYYCMKYQIPRMIERGGGAIVNTSSRAGDSAPNNMFMYTTTKHAVIGMTRSAAIDFAASNIRVNALLPGMTATPMLGFATEGSGLGSADTHAKSSIPLQRLGRADEQADAVVWLCSPESSYVTGVSLPVDGGNQSFNH
ncbi:hypothetical protein CH299_27745 [Rhodococcus sp. 14-2686-1-2]|nr:MULTISPECIES: glucose 1-dehydrogenase [unclassified Rhodococcus (in: high G+C Gram-positive bacteria)]OZE93557.1 hypothetical protein CH301_27225 [Rhodococcus sp. 15-1189-1-1a]OZF08483.1 hypothetical protein CH299_27745 [Rhodococcus sp. 14-2686-1-2]